MKKEMSFWWRLTIQIITLCFVGMLMTYVNELLSGSNFFGDTYSAAALKDCMLDDHHIWGARHYWYFWLMVLLFLSSLVRIVLWADWFWSKRNKKQYA